MTECHPPEIEWTWSDWARMGRLEDAAVTPAGRPLVEWALTVVADFYTDEWLRRQFRQGTVPVVGDQGFSRSAINRIRGDLSGRALRGYWG